MEKSAAISASVHIHNAQTMGKFITLIKVSELLNTKLDILCEHLLMDISG